MEKQAKLSKITENEGKRLFERKRKYGLEKHLKHVEKRPEIPQDLKYEGQERMVTGDVEDDEVNVGNGVSYLMNV